MLSSNAIRFLLSALITILLARILMPATFGLVATASIVVGFLQMVGSSGVLPALIRCPEISDAHMSAGRFLALSLSLVLFLILWFLSPLVESFFEIEKLANTIRIFSLSMLVTPFRILPEAKLAREMRFNRIAAAEMISFFIGYGLVGIYGAISGWREWALVSAYVAQATISTVLMNVINPVHASWQIERPAAMQIARFGWGLMAVKLVNFFALQTDNFVIAKCCGSESIGLYSRAHQVYHLFPRIAGQAMDNVLFAAVSSVQTNKRQVVSGFRKAMTLLCLTIPLLSGLLFVLADVLIVGILGENWGGSVLPLQILSVVLFFRMSYKLCTTVLRALGKISVLFWSQFFFASLVTIGAVAGSSHGIAGVSSGIAMAVFIIHVYFILLTRNFLGLSAKWLMQIHWQALAIGGLFFVITFSSKLVVTTFFQNQYVVLFIVTMFSGLSWVLFFVFFAHLMGSEASWCQHLLLARFSHSSSSKKGSNKKV